MKLVGMMIVRNEQWVLGCSMRVALRWCDEVCILDHGSYDDTPDIIADVARGHPGRVFTVRKRASDGWPEQTYRQELFELAQRRRATHFAIVDADEVPTGHLLADGGRHLRSLLRITPHGHCSGLWMIPTWRSLDCWRSDSQHWSHGSIVLGFPAADNLRWTPREDGYHLHARYPEGTLGVFNPCAESRSLGVMHLQYADWRRLEAKNWWYRMVERLQHPGHRPVEETNALYQTAFDEDGLTLHACPPHWWADIPERRHIRLGERPWHEDEIERLFAAHGSAPFRGLYLGPYTARIAA